jgi:hypothetical protein
MVLDPFSALSLAGNVLQFVDFGTRLASHMVELYQSASGITEDDAEILDLTHQFKLLAERLSVVVPEAEDEANTVVDRKSFQAFLSLCRIKATGLITLLEDLKVDRSHKLWSSVRQGFRFARKKKDIKELVEKISFLRDALNSYLLALLQ